MESKEYFVLNAFLLKWQFCNQTMIFKLYPVAPFIKIYLAQNSTLSDIIFVRATTFTFLEFSILCKKDVSYKTTKWSIFDKLVHPSKRFKSSFSSSVFLKLDLRIILLLSAFYESQFLSAQKVADFQIVIFSTIFKTLTVLKLILNQIPERWWLMNPHSKF